MSVRPSASPTPRAPDAPLARVPPAAAEPPASSEPTTLSELTALSERAAPPPFLVRVGESDSRDTEEEDLERDLDNLKKILQASWAT
jgi:hypothetical protein